MLDLLKPPTIGVRALICGLSHGAALFTDLVDMLAGQAGAPRPMPTVPAQHDCDGGHLPFPLPPHIAELFESALPQRTPEPEPADGHAWRPAFAGEVRERDLVSPLGGRPHPLRVVRLEERESPYGGPALVAMVVVDDSGAFSWSFMDALEGIRIAVEVPESAAALDGAA